MITSLFYVLLLVSCVYSRRRSNLWDGDTPLDEFMRDDTFDNGAFELIDEWEIIPEVSGEWECNGCTAYRGRMISQQWLDETFFDTTCDGCNATPHLWEHDVIIIIPDEVNTNYATIFGYQTIFDDEGLPADNVDDAVYVATSTKTIGVVVSDMLVSNVRFSIAPAPLNQLTLNQDELIGAGWGLFAATRNINFLLHLPMAKVYLRTMDLVEQFFKESTGNSNCDISSFGIWGASKNGWATWLATAADRRIDIFFPQVLDILNLDTNIRHMYSALDGLTWPFVAFSSFIDWRELINPDETSAGFAIREAIDPYSYIDRYRRRNKLIISSSRDFFFLPDNLRYWFDDLEGDKSFLMVPNSNHASDGREDLIFSSIASFITGVLNRESKLPELEWEIDYANDGTITLTIEGDTDKILSVATFTASTTCESTTQDFRDTYKALGSGEDQFCRCNLPTVADIGLFQICPNVIFDGTQPLGVSENTWIHNDITNIFINNDSSSDDDDKRTYIANFDSIPTDGSYVAMFIVVQYQLFEPNNPGEIFNDQNFDNQYGRILLTSEVSIQPDNRFVEGLLDCEINNNCPGGAGNNDILV